VPGCDRPASGRELAAHQADRHWRFAARLMTAYVLLGDIRRTG
jgi:hypothetical protein